MDKREQDVLDKVRQKTADIQVPKSLEPDNIRRMLEEKSQEKGRQRFRIRGWGIRQTSALIAACMVVVIGAVAWSSMKTSDMISRLRGVASGTGILEEIEIDTGRMIVQADSYDQVYSYLEEYQNRQKEIAQSYTTEQSSELADGGMSGGADMNSSAVAEIAAEDTADRAVSESAAQEAEPAAGGDYSETNVRQEGVDEGDIVKTDGTYLYVLEDEGDKIAVVDTRDQDMKKAASIEAGDDYNIYEFYVVPDKKKLVMVCRQKDQDTQMLEDSYPTYRGGGDSETTVAVTYDIQDPEKPKEEGRVSQSGSYSSSRMSDGYLYLFSEYHIWNEVSQTEPRYYVPLINGEMIEADNIYLPQISQANMYEVITAVDLEKPDRIKDSKAIFSKGGQLYVSNANIYFYEEEWGASKGCVTTVRKVAYKDGKLEAKVQGSFNGYLNDSFSIDEYDGNLRVVVTERTQKGDTNSVYILDKELEQVGSIENLAEDERIYSARFLGDTGYFVTFRETDPLFSVDLSDPKNPKIIGQLKIPGFSEYLHFYGEDRLLGIGMDADEETGTTDGVKLTMFDISDKTDVKEEDTYVLENVYGTDVSYDYKAVLISQERNLIGFAGYTQGGQNYFLFEYHEDNGFICNMEEKINGNGMRNPRGIYIEDMLYVVQGNIIEAYSLKDYKKTDDLIL